MFKFKMSLLVRSAKFKVAIVALLIASILAGVIFMPTNKAGTKAEAVNIKANEISVSIGGKKLYKIQKDGEFAGYNKLFCVQEGEDLSYQTYSNPIDISNAEAKNYFNHYNAARWLINNMYVSNVSGNGVDYESAKKILITNMATLITSDYVKNLVMSNYKFDGSGITPEKIVALQELPLGANNEVNAIEVVEQLALWKYTKAAEPTAKNPTPRYKSDTYRNNPNQYLEGTSLTNDQQKTLKYIFYGLTALADIKDGTTFTNTITGYTSLDASKATFSEATYKAGPYYLKSNGVTLTSYVFGADKTRGQFPIEITVTKNDGKQDVKTNDSAMIVRNQDGSFFIDLSAYKNNVKRVDFKIDNILRNVNTEAYIIDGKEQQDLMGVEKSLDSVRLTAGMDVKLTPPVNPEGQYNIVLKKVAEDGTTVITGSPATFKINGTEKNTDKGILNIESGKKITDVNAVANYEIVETKAPEGYTLFDGTMKLGVKFKAEGTKYVIDWDKTVKEGFVNGAKAEISADKTTITVTVPNKKTPPPATPEGQYNIVLKKVAEDGTTVITESPATFKINGTEKSTDKGILNIESGKKIADVNAVENYEIVETKAPEGYTLFDGTMKLGVKFKTEGTNYVIDWDKTVKEGFTNGAKAEISADKTTITVTVPNKKIPTPGEYNVELYKIDENGNLINTTAIFTINDKDVETKNGKIIVASNVKVNDENTVGKYVIKEKNAPENYKLFDGTMTLEVKMIKSGNTYVLREDGINFNVDKQNSGVRMLLDGNTIKIYVPNKLKDFDLSLRKFISKIDGVVVTPSREPIINIQSIINLYQTGTASYYHVKDSIGVTVGSEIEYTLRVYNEGDILGYAKQITDYLPEGLSFVRIADESKSLYTTESEVGSKTIVLNYKGNTEIKSLRDFYALIMKEQNVNTRVNVSNEYYQEVKVICKVENSNAQYITSRGEITNYGYSEKDAEGNLVWKEAVEIGKVDRDSIQNTIKENLDLDNWYENAKERTYKDKNGNIVTDKNYYPGVQDDDDFETVEILSGKYNIVIKKVDANNQDLTLEGAYFNVKGANVDTKVGPTNSKGLVTVVNGVVIENSKQVDEYTITETEAPYNYKLYSGDIKVSVATKYNGKAFVIDSEKTKVDGKDVKFAINKDNTTITIVVPNTKKQFDLSLRKFITAVNGEKLAESREPKVDVTKLANGESTTATYTHSKEPVDVNTTDVVTYTIRVFNEGEIDGYATKVMDDIPEGLEFLPENEINKNYKWVMYTEVDTYHKNANSDSITYNGKVYVKTNKASEADVIVTDYLSLANGEGNLIKAFDKQTKTLSYKDVEVAFKVIEPQTSDRIVINHAQITEHSDPNGSTDIPDRDSTPNKWNEGEDDQDIDKVKVRYFDLALRKWVTKVFVTENGKTTATETKHSAWDDPEPVVKVDLKNTEINNVVVKFEYSIRVYNQGEIAGYAKEVSDYIPQGLKFVAQDNPQWKEVDGKIVTTALENKLLQPGEYADVTVLLTWINGSENLGLKTNTAEISKDENEWGTPDIDSTPNNQVPGEDDIDDAPVILTIKTGEPIIYTGIAIGFIAIVSLGIVLIRKKVLDK